MSPKRRAYYKSKLIKQEMIDDRKQNMRTRLRRRSIQFEDSQESQESEEESPMMSLSRRGLRARRLECDGERKVRKTRRPETDDEDTAEEILLRRSSRPRRQVNLDLFRSVILFITNVSSLLHYT